MTRKQIINDKNEYVMQTICVAFVILLIVILYLFALNGRYLTVDERIAYLSIGLERK